MGATTNNYLSTLPNGRPLTIGVFGGSFNPVHLGHVLLAITTQQTKAVDQVVLVPVFKHAVKRNLLPFHDRVQMCILATASFGKALTVSTIEEEVGASNGEMLKALKTKYPAGTRFLWICGDDFIRWMDRPKGIETLQEVSGLIVQRRLHKQSTNGDQSTSSSSLNRFVQEPLDDAKMRRVANQLNLEIEFIYGELPHFSSTLVRRAPGHWKSFLTQSVVQYLDERTHLLQQLIDNLDQEEQESSRKKPKTQNGTTNMRNASSLASLAKAGAYVLQGLDVVNALQLERGRTGLYLSTGKFKVELKIVQDSTDARLVVDDQPIHGLDSLEEVLSLVAELKRTREWLNEDRTILEKRAEILMNKGGPDGWNARLAIVEKFNGRIDVLIGATIRALMEILEHSHEEVDFDVPELLLKWCEGKEALGRLRAFICAAGPEAPKFVQMSLKMRERLTQTIETKERCMDRVMALERGLSSRLSSPDALHKLLENVTLWEYKLMGCFAPTTPLALIHKFLENSAKEIFMEGDFDVDKFFEASTAAIDFLLSFAKALAASACATG